LTTLRFEVLLRDVPVGHLDEAEDGTKSFRFYDSYRMLAERPVLGQKFEDDLGRIYRGKREALPTFFANLVPEGRLRKVIERAGGVETGDDLGLLAFVGADLPGAVVLRPSEHEAEILNGNSVDRDDENVETPEVERESDHLRFSVAGVQMKFSMLRDSDKLTLPARGETGEWIVKFDSPVYPRLPENEYSMLEWSRTAGFDVPEVYLHEASHLEGLPRQFAPEGSRVLAIRRFDRNRHRIHQEDFAQVVGLPPTMKYDHVTYEVMVRLTKNILGDEGVDELVRRLALTVACGNNDAHLKNWSLIYPDGIQARWSPLYDQVSTVAWEGPDRLLSLKLAGVKEFGRIDRAAFERLAEKCNLDPARVIDNVRDTLTRLFDTWPGILPDLPIPESHVVRLREHWAHVPLLREMGSLRCLAPTLPRRRLA